MTSILNTIKKLLGIDILDDSFDVDVITHINSTFMILNHIGIGPEETFLITGATETWESFLGTTKNIDGVKSYVYLKVKLLFDPPTSSFVLEANNRIISELEWRLNNTTDAGLYLVPVDPVVPEV